MGKVVSFSEDFPESDKYINVEHLYKSFDELNVLSDINFSVRKNEFVCIVGGSGCGKSTLLRAMSGLDPDHEGRITVDGEEVTGPKKERGMVFQEPRLFPWLSVLKNVEFALDEGTKQEKEKKALEKIHLVGLEGFEDALPKQLSGGMAQRANIARALVNSPSILFLDEPFGALDAFTKINLQNELLNIKKEEGTTMIMVTHDIDEAVYLSDRIIIMDKNPGRIRDIVNVNLPRPRDRNDYYFMEVRKKVYSYFFETKEVHEEYNI